MGYAPDRSRRRSGLRVSDQERDRAAFGLRRHYEAGRLTAEELEDRVADAYRSVTRADLARLFDDLPRVASRRAMAEGFASRQRHALRHPAVTYARVNGALVGTWAATGGGEFWPAWSLIPWGGFLAWHGWGVRAMSRALRRGSPRRGLRA